MLNFLAWYLVVSLLGLLTFPLAYRLFPALADRGYTLTRALGLLLWGYIFWILASLGVLQNDLGGLLLAMFILLALNAWAFWSLDHRRQTVNNGESTVHRPSSILAWLKTNLRLVITTEVLFFLAFVLWAFVRACRPNIETAGGEKVMEVAFINAILHSPTFPPHDPWLSGYAISYYYFGYLMAAMLARLTGTLGSVAHNLMSALIFALSAVGAYGILYNLLSAYRNHTASDRQPPTANRQTPVAKSQPLLANLSLLGPLFLLLVGNLEGFLAILQRHNVFWKLDSNGVATSTFWKWLGIAELQDAPHYFDWFWRASRVVQDCALVGKNCGEVIDEFPAFSFLLGDLHPHVLVIPFGLLAIQMALNLLLGGWKGETKILGFRIPVPPLGLVFTAVVLGGLAFLNTWDILPFTALFLAASVIRHVRERGWGWERLEELFALAIPLGVLCLLLYLPFFAGFSSQAGGILPNLINPTRGAHLWVMFGPLFIPIFAYLVYLWRAEKQPVNWLVGGVVAMGISLLLWVFSWLVGLLASRLQYGSPAGLAQSQGFSSFAGFFAAATVRRFAYIGGWLTLAALLAFAIAFLARAARHQDAESPASSKESASSLAGLQHSVFTVHHFILLLILIGSLLVLAPDYIFLHDIFGYRTNTVFKFYFQAWILWSMAAAFGAAVLLQNLRRLWGWVYGIGLGIVLLMALCFFVNGLPYKANDFKIATFQQRLKTARAAGDPAPLSTALSVWTLDGARLFESQYPDDAAAARWLAAAPPGVVAEAVSLDTYSDYGRMSVYSGQPAVLGWWWHEYQWRGSLNPQLSPIQDLTCRAAFSYDSRRMRSDDVACLYSTTNWNEASEIITQYNIRYIVVGTLERNSMHLDEAKFQVHLLPIFKSGNVVIYEVP